MRLRHDPLEVVVNVRIVEALADALQGIASYVKQQGLNWQIHCVDAEEFTKMVRRGAPDSAITTISPKQPEMIAAVQRIGLPVVNLFHNLEPEIPSVLSDDESIGREAAEYLLRCGFRSFSFLGLSATWSDARQRGFMQALRLPARESLIDITPPLVLHARTINSVRSIRRRQKWLASLQLPSAVLVSNDFLATLLLNDCNALKIRVPEDLAVLGVDNLVRTCELARVPLSSVAQDFSRIGFEAARVLDLLVSKKARPRGPILVPPGNLAPRRSTDVLAFEDPHVSTAMRVIQQSAHAGLQMKELLRQVPVSRRWLDARFKTLVGHTPAEEIRRLRLERIRDLLSQTDLSVKEIAIRCGFTCGENMVRFFRDGYGVPPTVYRKQRNRIASA